MASTALADTPHETDPSPGAFDAFMADRQAFWGRFTRFVTMGASGVVVLLILMAIFLL